MPNTLLTPQMITNEALRVLENNLVFAKNVNREYSDQFAKSGAKIGATVNVRKPPRFVGRTGAAIGIEDVTDTQVPLNISTQFGVDFTFSSQDLTLSADDFSNRYLKPAMAAIANKIDRDGLALALGVANTVGTPGTPISSATPFLTAGALMDLEGTPRDDQRGVVLDPFAQANLVDALKGLFQSGEKIKAQYEKGIMGQALGFDFAMDQNVNAYTVGPQGGVPLVNGANQTGSALVTNGWTAAAATRLNVGDVFTIAGVFAVNPQSRQSTGRLRQFVVTAQAASDAGGNATLQISPAITPAGQFQNVTNSPANGAAITVLGAANTVSNQSLAYHKDAFTLATVDLEDVSQYGAWGARANYKGISIRIVRQYAIGTDTVPCRLDVLYGWKALYPELACRICTS
ncbi:P22 coat protein - gene protein 5 [Noviherbaspirillum humi]|uniref:P22 coat protein - gene protein 5 n=1 Tax=Noviherbaspirillum humi TaxID=1688639 RepID=A0A239LV94_9BURK|nr:P22 phage major capsid protein family protein [Noviherbaspirillum humi]SNT33723.1 P22 coat protein - gene protein 5 [Noviherbaspirillum humi]